MGQTAPWVALSVEERAEIAEAHHLETLYYCPHAWALRHEWLNRATGEVQRARCNRWDCPYCGPRKVALWRQLVKEAEPVLFLTLTKAGKTLPEAARALTTFIQALRRGSKGKGPNHVGARPAYPVEYFAVLEEHRDFEQNGFHWHILIKGVDHLPYKEVIKPLWMSATHYRPATEEEEGRGAENGWIERIRTPKAIGYVTKYLMKAVTKERQGTKQVQRQRVSVVKDADGILHLAPEMVTDSVVSKTHRIRYSRHFFPERVEELRRRLFAGLEQVEQEKAAPDETIARVDAEKAAWVLVDRWEQVEGKIAAYKQERMAQVEQELAVLREQGNEECYQDYERQAIAEIAIEIERLQHDLYRRWCRERLIQALEEGKHLSYTVVNMWFYHRQEVRLVG
jgi:hypothetical protein